MQEDQWKHRSDNMKCKTCMWFVPKPELTPVLVDTDKINLTDEIRKIEMKPGKIYNIHPGETVSATYSIGRCRRHAPTLGGWPVVFVNDWCGDHKIDENKI